jgi:hypothetical protein
LPPLLMRAIRRSGGKPPFPTSDMPSSLVPMKLLGPKAPGIQPRTNGPREGLHLTNVFSSPSFHPTSWMLVCHPTSWTPVCRLVCRRVAVRRRLNRLLVGEGDCGAQRGRQPGAGWLRVRAFHLRVSSVWFLLLVKFPTSFAARKDLFELTSIVLNVRPAQIAFIAVRVPFFTKSIAERPGAGGIRLGG